MTTKGTQRKSFPGRYGEEEEGGQQTRSRAPMLLTSSRYESAVALQPGDVPEIVPVKTMPPLSMVSAIDQEMSAKKALAKERNARAVTPGAVASKDRPEMMVYETCVQQMSRTQNEQDEKVRYHKKNKCKPGKPLRDRETPQNNGDIEEGLPSQDANSTPSAYTNNGTGLAEGAEAAARPGPVRVRGIDYAGSASEFSEISLNDDPAEVPNSGENGRELPTLEAHLVTENGVDMEERERIKEEARREAQEELHKEQEVVGAEAVDVAAEQRHKRHVRGILLLAIILVIVAVVVGSILGTRSQRGADESNDFCEDAFEFGDLSQGDQFRVASTVGATEDEVGQCGTSNNNGLGVWFTAVGTGKIMTFSTCGQTNIDTQISVFVGGCADLICVDGNDNVDPVLADFCGSDTSQVTFESTEGEVYNILVTTAVEGEVTLLAGSTEPFEKPTRFGNNDMCEDAIDIEFPAIFPLVQIEGNFLNATIDNISPCGSADNSSPGVWFRVVGTGDVIAIDTCLGDDSDVDTQISVFQGSCSGLVCVDGNDNGDSFLCFSSSLSEVSWQSIEGEEYFILLSSEDVGDVTLTAQTVAPTPAPMPFGGNDLCEDAIDIKLLNSFPFSVIDGDFLEATVDNVGACGSSTNTNPGIWFRVLGTGNNITMDTCFGEGAVDTQLSSFLGIAMNLRVLSETMMPEASFVKG